MRPTIKTKETLKYFPKIVCNLLPYWTIRIGFKPQQNLCSNSLNQTRKAKKPPQHLFKAKKYFTAKQLDNVLIMLLILHNLSEGFVPAIVNQFRVNVECIQIRAVWCWPDFVSVDSLLYFEYI